MLRTSSRVRRVVLAVLPALGLWACGDEIIVQGGDDGGAGVSVAVTGSTSVVVGQTLQLEAATTGDTDSSYAWSSSDEDVATVDADGLVTAVSVGEATITATGADSGEAGTKGIAVIAAPVVQVNGAIEVAVKGTATLTATTVGGTDSAYAWSSSDEDVATVDADGVVSGIAPGTVTITATGADTAAAGTLGLSVQTTVPNLDLWGSSAHAAVNDEPFNHWNADGEIPASCARCHSTPGFRDYIGDDGTDAGVVDNPAPIGTVIECSACHNDTAAQLSTVTFPSGVTISDLGGEARCMTCHQGRASKDSVDQAITAAGANNNDAGILDAGSTVGEDEPDTDIAFTNIHYYAAGATLEAGRVHGGYEYDGKVYDWRFRHVLAYDTCIECHNPHSLEVRVDKCAGCHVQAGNETDGYDKEGLKDIRMQSSIGIDYDGDGNVTEGIYHEAFGDSSLQSMLLTAIQTYATAEGLPAICYAVDSYPYFFVDGDADGSCSASEAAFATRYTQFTPRLLKAAYNYQLSRKDPGAFAHNAKYIIELLYDSIENVNEGIEDAGGTAVDLSSAQRNDEKHFNGAGEPARHWDEQTADGVPATCSKCHSGAEGFQFFIQYGVGTQVLEQDNGLQCETCHASFSLDDNDDLVAPLIEVSNVYFPGDVVLGTSDIASNTMRLCSNCHSGRESKITIDDYIATHPTVNTRSFRNVHYLPAGAMWQGTNVQLGYEYDELDYQGTNIHADVNNDGEHECSDCHSIGGTDHSFDIDLTRCTVCHGANASVDEIGLEGDVLSAHNTVDADGDGVVESFSDEIDGLAADLLTALQTAALSATDGAICYNPDRYPYFLKDTNGNGECDSNETGAYKSFTDAMLKAAHNYQISVKEPGKFAHNWEYMAELLIDSIRDLQTGDPTDDSGDLHDYTRPEPEN